MAIRVSLGLLIVLGMHTTAAQATYTDVFNIEASISKAQFETNITTQLTGDCILESALRAEGKKPEFRLPYCRVQGDTFDFFLGRASIEQGRALRNSPTAQVPVNSGSFWSAQTESNSADLLAGIHSGSISFLALCDTDSIIDLATIVSDFNPPNLSFKAAAMEFAVKSGVFSWAAGSSAAMSNEKKSPEGWQSADASYEPAIEALSAAASGAVATKTLGIDLWAATCLGSLIPPGWAGMLEFRLGGIEFGNPSRGAKSNSLGSSAQDLERKDRAILEADSDRKLSPSISLKGKAFVSSHSYRNFLLEKPSLDCALQCEVSLAIHRYTLWASLQAFSPSEEGAGTNHRSIAESGIPTLLWLWRPETLIGRAGVGWEPWAVSARAKTDQSGVASLDFKLGYAGLASKNGQLNLKSALHIYLKQGLSELGDDDLSDLFAQDEDEGDGATASSSGVSSSGLTKIADSIGGLVFYRSKLEFGLAWGNKNARGGASIAIAVSKADSGLEFLLYGEASQRIGLGSRCSIELALVAPSSGYALDRLPEMMPTMSAGFQLRKAQNQR